MDSAHPNNSKHYGYTLQYDGQGELWFITQQRWEGATCSDPEIVSCREFRANGRNMRMTTKRDPQFLDVIEPDSRVWHDYDGEDIYSDLGVAFGEFGNNMTMTELASQEPGTGAYDRSTAESTYHHGDQIGTTRVVSDQSAAASARIVYTAFGERVWSDGSIGTRYQYVGAYGYQTMPEYASGMSNGFEGEPGDAVPFVHVGHRWYDPPTGRFMQRDPIGLAGGLNVYRYVYNRPILAVDPLGEKWWQWIVSPIDYAQSNRRNLDIADRLNKAYCNAVAEPAPSPAKERFIKYCESGAGQNAGLKAGAELIHDAIDISHIAHGVGGAGGPVVEIVP